MKKIIYLLLGLTLTSCFLSKNDLIEKGWSDFEHLDLRLKGKVYYINNKIGNGFHARGIMRVKILESNIKKYDPRKRQANYYCIINDSIAELYDNHLQHIYIGDTITINTNEQTIEFVNKSNKEYKYSISIEDSNFFDFLKEQNYEPFSDKKIIPRWR